MRGCMLGGCAWCVGGVATRRFGGCCAVRLWVLQVVVRPLCAVCTRSVATQLCCWGRPCVRIMLGTCVRARRPAASDFGFSVTLLFPASTANVVWLFAVCATTGCGGGGERAAALAAMHAHAAHQEAVNTRGRARAGRLLCFDCLTLLFSLPSGPQQRHRLTFRHVCCKRTHSMGLRLGRCGGTACVLSRRSCSGRVCTNNRMSALLFTYQQSRGCEMACGAPPQASRAWWCVLHGGVLLPCVLLPVLIMCTCLCAFVVCLQSLHMMHAHCCALSEHCVGHVLVRPLLCM